MPLPRLSAAARIFVCAGVLLAVYLVIPTGAFGVASPRHAGDSGRSVAEVESYWTPQRMEKARPLDIVASRDRGGTPHVAGSTTPSSSTVPYSSFEVPDTLSFPNRVHGKVFFTRPGVGNFVCSGTVVDAQNRSTVITAGHCVRDAGAWSTNFVFAPGYRTVSGIGYAPYGLWGASEEAAPAPWVDSGILKFDVGAAVLAKDPLGHSLEDVVGARGIAFNWPTSQAFRSYGYPAEPTATHAFDGMRLWACDSAPPVTADPAGAAGPATMGIGCDMTGGSSGGGWVSGGYLNGVNSYRYSNQPEMMYGPYFGATIKALYDFAAVRPPGVAGSQAVGNRTPDLSAPAASPGPVSAPKTACRRPPKRKRAKRGRSAKRACRAKR